MEHVFDVLDLNGALNFSHPMPSIADITDFLRDLAPLDAAASWDNVGLLLGDARAAVERVMTCLTVTPESAAEAIAEKAQVIVSHHPILFRPVQRLTTDTPEGRLLLDLARAGVAVYSAHTAFDNAPGGINDLLADKLGLANVKPLRIKDERPQCKIVVFVPDADLAKVSDALFAAGAGRIGQYSECGFRLAGTGTFFGSEQANPTVGQKGRREEVSEWRLEVICPEARIADAVAAMRRAHSYEEPAFDVYPLKPGSRGGEGRVGELSQATPLKDVAARARETLGALCVQMVGDSDRPVRRVAIACGAAGEFLNDARKASADVFLTGEIRFHDCLAAQAHGISLILPGHYATERCGVEMLARKLQQQFTRLEVWASRREREPLTLL